MTRHAGSPSQSREAEFRRARRHASIVRVLKIGLPLVAILILVSGAAAIWFARSLPDDVSVTSAAIDDGQVVMEDPRMSGVDGEDRPYELIARRAIQSLDGTGITLDKIEAKVPVNDETSAEIAATTGYYDASAGMLSLTEGIRVKTNNGVSIQLAGANIDLSEGTLHGQGPVLIKSAGQTIRSETLKVSDSGKLLSFGGGVRMLIEPDSLKEQSATFLPKSN
ncbi:LPS export ABC transporter periplasmic protein LptC [Jiella marina]|uniref:LPS export ABC transporter periplasmic protein LptC n=1 Tax=Jiella sp. LLJ827 TaxID=2917712 RepID=UPI00210092DC|nr:LPS export ABC transporter periplasmic protein LptC [Jiella sp. LLJ827]MCQ0989512.1 LPS export ABC transporter periplasmic protein LptC [Jiella sp. LLJ827]